MNDVDISRLLEVVLDAVQGPRVRVLIGILKHSVADMLCCLEETVGFLQSRTGAATAGEAVSDPVWSVSLCVHRRAIDLSQAAIRAASSAKSVTQACPRRCTNCPR